MGFSSSGLWISLIRTGVSSGSETAVLSSASSEDVSITSGISLLCSLDNSLFTEHAAKVKIRRHIVVNIRICFKLYHPSINTFADVYRSETTN